MGEWVRRIWVGAAVAIIVGNVCLQVDLFRHQSAPFEILAQAWLENRSPGIPFPFMALHHVLWNTLTSPVSMEGNFVAAVVCLSLVPLRRHSQ